MSKLINHTCSSRKRSDKRGQAVRGGAQARLRLGVREHPQVPLCKSLLAGSGSWSAPWSSARRHVARPRPRGPRGGPQQRRRDRHGHQPKNLSHRLRFRDICPRSAPPARSRSSQMAHSRRRRSSAAPCQLASAAFIKTSTGFGKGRHRRDIALMRRWSARRWASGLRRVRTAGAEKMRLAGAGGWRLRLSRHRHRRVARRRGAATGRRKAAYWRGVPQVDPQGATARRSTATISARSSPG
jgi:hypothetical protein